MAIREQNNENPKKGKRFVPPSRTRDNTKAVIVPLAQDSRDHLKRATEKITLDRNNDPFYVTDAVREALDNWFEMQGLQRHCQTPRRKVNRADFVAFALSIFSPDALVEEIKRQVAP